ncbi:hypothetical protein PPACK8108_LOCUS10130 [Phakopsora pachyrhizi]|uniref:Uncharacterized protein n=1 Tax=Phakopsora pachyrhizi TaxID=170000 RepID=A0AAV0AZ98_PHAPC|nr:hypothetical protein PPACK8108_LOCUS10130 [Phakopsora pachyrhizi]
MVLILGRPKNGVTSILRAISWNHKCLSEVTGQLDFGNLLTDAMITTRLRPQIVIIEETDNYFPSLQVLDTLNIAARCKTPKTWPGRMSRAKWVQSKLDLRSSEESVADSLGSGHQICFGPASDALEYFKELGFLQTPNQPIADFLCSVTDPSTTKIQLETSRSVPMRLSEFVAD